MVYFNEDIVPSIDADNIEDILNSGAYLRVLTNLIEKKWTTINTASQIDFMTKRMALLQGLPFTIFSYAAGIFRSNNKYNLFGLIDLLTYISRLNILGSINIRPDITFTFLNEQKILDGYIATYNNGILGSALNIFMHPNDFLTMDEIIDKTYNELNKITEIDNVLYKNIQNNLRAKISINSLSSPKYFKLNSKNDGIHLDEELLKKYKSIIYGGIDYEQFEIILNNISSFANDLGRGVDMFIAPKFIFHYYIDFNYEELEKIAYIYQNPIDSSWTQIIKDNNLIEPSFINIVEESSYNITYYNSTNYINNLDSQNDEFYQFKYSNYILIDRIKRFNQNFDLSYNDLFKYFFKDIFKCEYNYGQIYFFQKHKKIKYIYLPASIIQNLNWFPNWPRTSNDFDKRLIQIYNYEYDDLKKNLSEPEFSIILMPTKTTEQDIKEGIIGTFTYQPELEKMFRQYDGMSLINSNDQHLIRTKYGTKSPIKKFYTILAGYDDNLSYKYLDELKNYSSIYNRLSDNIQTIIDNTYLCYYDGNVNTFKKIILKSNSKVTLNNFNGIKKVTNYNTNNLFNKSNYNKVNIIEDITEFVYNINEGKASSIDIVNNNILSYNNGLILGIDCVLLIYLSQIYYEDYQRIFTSDEIFDVYIDIITNNIIDNSSISYNVKNKFNNINKILNNNYSINNDDTIINNLSNITYEKLSDLSLNNKNDFFIKTSEIFKRDIFTTNQKSEYKILEFKNSNPSNLNNMRQSLLDDFDRAESKWYDITYKYENIVFESIINNPSNEYYYKIMNVLPSNFPDNYKFYINNGYNLNTYKNTISIYESYIALRSISKHFLENYTNVSDKSGSNIYTTDLNNNLNNIIFDLYDNYKIFKDYNGNENIFVFAERKGNIWQIVYFEIYFYKFIFTKFNGNKNKSLKYLVLFYKFILSCVLSSNDYYKYINDTIDSSLNIFSEDKDNIFVEYIKLDESPNWKSELLNTDENINSSILNDKCLNFTLTDIFIKDLSYNTSIPIDYHRTLESSYFNKKNSDFIYKIIKFIFRKPNSGLTHDLYEIFDFINTEVNIINKNTDDYIFNTTNESISYYKAYILLINSIYENTYKFDELSNIPYKNYYLKNDNKTRYDLLEKFKEMH